MKLISLNAWCGIMYKPLKSFIEKHSKDVDIFCFQEIRNGEYLIEGKKGWDGEQINLFEDIKSILPNHMGYLSEMDQGIGIAVFIKKNIEVEKVDTTELLSKEDTNHIKTEEGWSYYANARLMQSVYLKYKNLIIHNLHGIPGSEKKDTPERELQTKRILDVLNKSKNPQIVVGDFNLNMKTEAISKLEDNMRNLVKEGQFKTTRNKNYPNYLHLPFADYVFISKEIKVKDFQVLEDEVSDHLPLLLEFN